MGRLAPAVRGPRRRGEGRRRGRPPLRRLRAGRHRRDGRSLARACRRRRRAAPGRTGRRDRDAADRGRHVGRRRARAALRHPAVELLADRDRREPLGAASVPRDDERPYVLVFSHCYHGSVDETFVTLGGDGRPRSREGNVGPAVDPTVTTRVCEFNDLEAVERLLADEQVACVLAEPALTNIGIVLPEDGFLEGVRAACERTGTLLICDETHTLSAGPGGCTGAWDLQPDLVTIGKAIAGGLPIGAYGVSAEVAARIESLDEADLVDVGGV